MRLIEADRNGVFELLERQAEPECWRCCSSVRGASMTLRPDAYVSVAVGDLERRAFLEVDRGSESSGTIERKLDACVSYWKSGRELGLHGLHPLTLWLASDRARVDQLEHAVKRQPQAARALFGVVPFDELVRALAEEKTVEHAQRS